MGYLLTWSHHKIGSKLFSHLEIFLSMYLSPRVNQEMFLIIEATDLLPGIGVGERSEPHHLVLESEEPLQHTLLCGDARGGLTLAEVLAELGQRVCVLMEVVKVK